MNRRKLMTMGLAGLSASVLSPIAAFAQSRYPDRPIRVIVPFSAGGATDVVGRLWADRVRGALGTVVIENKASGGGALGASEVARAQPDGYTLLFGNTSTQVLLPVLMSPPLYDPLKDFAAVYILCLSPTVIVVHPSVPARTLAELIAYAKANPGRLSYGSAGAGTLTNLAGELFKQLIAAPDIPTAIEAGLPGMVAANLNGLFVPAGVAPAIVDQIAQATRKLMADEAFGRLLVASGFEPTAQSGPAQAQRLVADELARWTPIMRATNFKME